MTATVTHLRMWTKRDGTKVPVREMHDAHLVNAIKMCRHQGLVSEPMLLGPMPMGEMAQYAWEQECEEAWDKYFPPLKWLEEEAARRGLKVPPCES